MVCGVAPPFAVLMNAVAERAPANSTLRAVCASSDYAGALAAARPAVGSIVTRTPLPAEVDESRFVERCAELVVVKGIEHSARVLRGWNPRQMSFRAFLTLLARVVVERELA